MKFQTLILAFLIALLAVQAPPTRAQDESSPVDTPELWLQRKADDLYRNGHWERAHFIYVNELAALGDKYAQYMAGYMYLNGKGVERDKVQAAAWYRLAAERDGKEFIKVRDELLESMSEESRVASDEIFISLRPRYSDLVLILDQLREEREALEGNTTGSRLSGKSTSVTILDPRTGMTMSRSAYIGRLERRMKLQLDYLASKLDLERIDPDMDDDDFESLEAQVTAWLASVNDRQVGAPHSE